MSPRSMPRRFAVSGWISTHELQQILETGSGSSCSHGLFAPRPSPRVGDGNVTRKNSPCEAGAAMRGAGAAAAMVRAGRVPEARPFGRAAAKAVGAPGDEAITHHRQAAG